MKILRDTWLVFQQAAGKSARTPVFLVVLLFQPLLFLFFFGPLLQNSLRGLTQSQVINLYVPGLMVQLALYGTLFSCFTLTPELRDGVIERYRVTPISRFALLMGRSLRDTVALVLQEVVLLLLALPLGLRVGFTGVVAMLVMVATFGLGISAVSYGLAIGLRRDEVLGPLINAVSLPLLLLSGILIPMTFAPRWLDVLSKFNPLTYVVDASRALFADTIWNRTVSTGLIVSFGLAAVALAVVTRLFIRNVD